MIHLITLPVTLPMQSCFNNNRTICATCVVALHVEGAAAPREAVPGQLTLCRVVGGGEDAHQAHAGGIMALWGQYQLAPAYVEEALGRVGPHLTLNLGDDGGPVGVAGGLCDDNGSRVVVCFGTAVKLHRAAERISRLQEAG